VDHNSPGGVNLIKSAKAVSIQPFSKDKFLVLDSAGALHVFSLQNTELAPEATKTYCLDCAMKVQLFAAFPSSSTKCLCRDTNSLGFRWWTFHTTGVNIAGI
jgi:hypothetical protein